MGEEKMSKSLGNVKSIDNIRDAGFSPMDLRYLFLSVHYRTQLKFAEKGLEDAHKARRKIMEWMNSEEDFSHKELKEDDQEKLKEAKEFLIQFTRAMDSDLNTPAALAVVFEMMTWYRNAGKIGGETRFAVQDFIEMVRNTFGCFDSEEKESIPEEVKKLLEERKEARDSKDFVASDALRDQIRDLGYEVRDLPEGQKIDKM